jgi:hypothetical protein
MTVFLLFLILLAVMGGAAAVENFFAGIIKLFLFGLSWAVIAVLLTWAWAVVGPLDPLWQPLLVGGGGSLLLTAWLFSLPYRRQAQAEARSARLAHEGLRAAEQLREQQRVREREDAKQRERDREGARLAAIARFEAMGSTDPAIADHLAWLRAGADPYRYGRKLLPPEQPPR